MHLVQDRDTQMCSLTELKPNSEKEITISGHTLASEDRNGCSLSIPGSQFSEQLEFCALGSMTLRDSHFLPKCGVRHSGDMVIFSSSLTVGRLTVVSAAFHKTSIDNKSQLLNEKENGGLFA